MSISGLALAYYTHTDPALEIKKGSFALELQWTPSSLQATALPLYGEMWYLLEFKLIICIFCICYMSIGFAQLFKTFSNLKTNFHLFFTFWRFSFLSLRFCGKWNVLLLVLQMSHWYQCIDCLRNVRKMFSKIREDI